MGYNRQNLIRIKDAYKTKRQNAIKLSEDRRRAIHAISPQIEEIDQRLSATGLKLFQAACSGGESLQERLTEVRRENEKLLQKRASLLTDMGYSADYTEVHYECSSCSDTGYLPNTYMCPCMKRALTMEGFKTSGLGTLIERQSFDNFSLDYYAENAENLDRMKTNLQIMREYAENFSSASSNLLLMGGTGLGKTHLSTAVARIVIERGYDVLYDTAPNIFADFEHDKFKSNQRDEEARGDKYLDCDLLIIDDLGTEIHTQFTLSCLYNLVNTRLNRGKATIISTNLMQKELLSRYDARLTSRFFGEYQILQFKGRDIRLQKN